MTPDPLSAARAQDAAIAEAPISPAGGIACGDNGCHPLTREQAETLWAAAKEQQRKRAELMPDDQSALRAMTNAHHRLTELGWRDAIYAPKHEDIEMIEVGSSGIHRGYRDDMGFWIQDSDTWPSRPVLFRKAAAALAVLREGTT